MKPIKPILFIAIVLFGCTPPPQFSMEFTALDLREFERNGIYVSTLSTSRPYQSVAVVELECVNGYIKKTTVQEQEKRRVKDDLYFDSFIPVNMKDYERKTCYIEDMFNVLIKETKRLGANGLINFDIISDGPVFTMTGLAIRIE